MPEWMWRRCEEETWNIPYDEEDEEPLEDIQPLAAKDEELFHSMPWWVGRRLPLSSVIPKRAGNTWIDVNSCSRQRPLTYTYLISSSSNRLFLKQTNKQISYFMLIETTIYMFCKNITCMTSSCRAVKAARLWRSRSCRQTQQKRRNCQYFHSENLRLCWSKKISMTEDYRLLWCEI